MSLKHLSDRKLLTEIERALGARCLLTAQLLEYLAEVEARHLHLREAYSSMYDFCLRRLGLSEGSAFRHVLGARTCKRFPLALTLIRSGRLHLTGLCMTSKYLTRENHAALLAAVSNKSKPEIEVALRTQFPKPDVPESIRRLPNRTTQPSTQAVAPLLHGVIVGDRAQSARNAPVQNSVDARATCATEFTPSAQLRKSNDATGSAAPPSTQFRSDATERRDNSSSTGSSLAGSRDRVAPLSETRFHVQFTLGAEARDKLERALNLTSHTNAKRSVAVLFERAIDLLLRDIENKKLGKTDRPRTSKGAQAGAISRAARREIYDRDGERCSYVSKAGRRCDSPRFIEMDHVQSRARGGSGAPENARVYCRGHNRLHAIDTFGAAYVRTCIGRATPAVDRESDVAVAKPADESSEA